MGKRRPIKEIANNMQKDLENVFQNLVRNHIAEILNSDSDNEQENSRLMDRNAELERQVKALKVQLEDQKRETEESKKKLLEAAKLKKKNAELQRKVDLKKENFDLKRKLVLYEHREKDMNKSNTSTSPNASPQSSPEIFPRQQLDTELESPVKRLKFDKKEKPKNVLRMESPKKVNSPPSLGWLHPRTSIAKPKLISAFMKMAKETDQKEKESAAKKVEAPKKKESFVFDNTFDSTPIDLLKTARKSTAKRNDFGSLFRTDLALKPKAKPTIEVPKVVRDEEKKVVEEKIDETLLIEPIIKEEPMTQHAAVKFNDPFSQEIFTDSNCSVIFQEQQEPAEIPIYTISDSTTNDSQIVDDDGGYKPLPRKLDNLSDFEGFFKNHAIQTRDIYDGECSACKQYYDKRATEIDVEKANMEIIECDEPCKGFRLRVAGIRKKPGYVPNYQFIRVNKRLPSVKQMEGERFTPEGFWDVNLSPVKNQHMRPRKH